jgi:hypothetical protein
MIIPRDIDIRYISDGNMKGTWMDIQSGARVFLGLGGSLPDSIMIFVDVFNKWEAQAMSKNVAITKTIGTYSAGCMYETSAGTAGVGNATLDFRFVSAEEDIGIISTMMVVIIKLESYTSDSDPQNPDPLAFTSEKTQEFYTAMRNLNKLIKQAKAKDNAASDFTR